MKNKKCWFHGDLKFLFVLQAVQLDSLIRIHYMDKSGQDIL